MTTKRVVLSAHAGREVRQITARYKKGGGTILARRWVAAIEGSLSHIGSCPNAGSARYAVALKLDRLRFRPLKSFPYLVFYVEHEDRIGVGRVLHTKHDIPAWMGSAE